MLLCLRGRVTSLATNFHVGGIVRSTRAPLVDFLRFLICPQPHYRQGLPFVGAPRADCPPAIHRDLGKHAKALALWHFILSVIRHYVISLASDDRAPLWPDIGHLMDTKRGALQKVLILLARPTGLEPVLPP